MTGLSEKQPRSALRIERAEELVRGLGFRRFRVHDHGDLARLEFARGEMGLALSAGMAARLSSALKALGFLYVTLDGEGLRSQATAAAPSPDPASTHAHRLP